MDPARQLELARRDLLDLSLWNGLLNCRRNGKAGLEVVDELSDEVFRILVREERRMSFLSRQEEELQAEGQHAVASELGVQGDWLGAGKQRPVGDGARLPAGAAVAYLGQPGEPAGTADRHTDSRLQTALGDEALQTRLLRVLRRSRSFLEEQGINALYLALGFLRWKRKPNDQERWAPLVLVPVRLSRTRVQARFRLRFPPGEEIETNLSLAEKLREFHLELPELSPDGEFQPSSYLQEVRRLVAGQDDWSVEEDSIHLGFFIFTKLRMYKDLEASAWPTPPHEHPILGAALDSESSHLGGGRIPSAVDDGTVVPLESVGTSAYLCRPDHDRLRQSLSNAVAAGRLRVGQSSTEHTNGARR